LCGGFNTNTNRKIEALYQELAKKHPGAEVSAIILGKKPAEYYRRVGRKYIESVENLADDPNNWPTQEVCQRLELDFLKGEFDELYLVYTRFRSAISTVPTAERLLPLDKEALATATSAKTPQAATGVTLFEPNPQRVFDAVVPRIVRAIVRQAAFDTKASEHASRMTAMDNATKNAKELIHSLTLTRNKLRQTGITSQLLDIVGGAEALK
jgi:F-type H+-transporting ATPase subunit gamma